MIVRLIAEIESYLATPMRDSWNDDEQEERIFLCDLLAMLRRQCSTR